MGCRYSNFTPYCTSAASNTYNVRNPYNPYITYNLYTTKPEANTTVHFGP